MKELLRKKERVKRKQAKVKWDSSDESDGKEMVKIRNKPRNTSMDRRVKFEATSLPITGENTGSFEKINTDSNENM